MYYITLYYIYYTDVDLSRHESRVAATYHGCSRTSPSNVLTPRTTHTESMASAEAGAQTKFDAFEIRDTYYKEVDGHRIPVSVLSPKHSQGGECPVMVRWHGGGFVTGERLFADW